MGSPWKICSIRMKGAWIPALPTENWQDLKAISPDQRYLGLVQWNTRNNEPGFHIIRIDVHKRTFHKTKRITGICRSLEWEQDRFIWRRV